ncbi:MAG: hypothetical protein CSA62_05760 [Planctomycetota bacterium]|nr:MAG: hypothetical protein CSA62_05760 [Planctomycetota bacterium]
MLQPSQRRQHSLLPSIGLPSIGLPAIGLRSFGLQALLLLALVSAGSLLSACQLNGEEQGLWTESLGPDEIRFESDPDETDLWVDGQLRGQTAMSLPLRYYGEYRIEMQLAPKLPGRQFFVPATIKREIAPPATPWIFPFDFLLEIAQRSLGWKIEPVKARLESRKLATEQDGPNSQADIDAADAAALRRQ